MGATMTFLNSRRHVIFAAASGLVLIAAPAGASPVSIDFTINSFTSTIASPNSVPQHTYVNGQEITGLTQDVPFTVNSGFTGNSVEFYENDFGEQTHNIIGFTPAAPSNVSVGQKFLFGSFNFTNGTWFGPADIAFTMTSVSADPALSGFQYSDTLHMALNPFVLGDPDAGADFIYLLGLNGALPTCSGTGGTTTACSLRVYELFDSPTGSNTGTIDLLGMISSLDPLELKNPKGASFLSGSIGSNVDPILASGVTTPLPSTMLLFGSGLAALAAGIRRRKAV